MKIRMYITHHRSSLQKKKTCRFCCGPSWYLTPLAQKSGTSEIVDAFPNFPRQEKVLVPWKVTPLKQKRKTRNCTTSQVIQSDLLIPQLEVTQPLKWSLNHPKKVTSRIAPHPQKLHHISQVTNHSHQHGTADGLPFWAKIHGGVREPNHRNHLEFVSSTRLGDWEIRVSAVPQEATKPVGKGSGCGEGYQPDNLWQMIWMAYGQYTCCCTKK